MLISALHEQSQKFEGSKKTSKPVHENDFEMSYIIEDDRQISIAVALSFETAGTADVAACSGRDRGSSCIWSCAVATGRPLDRSAHQGLLTRQIHKRRSQTTEASARVSPCAQRSTARAVSFNDPKATLWWEAPIRTGDTLRYQNGNTEDNFQLPFDLT